MLHENLLRIQEAADKLHVNFSTVFRWLLKGCQAKDGSRIRLRGVRLGGSWFTSMEALEEFGAALTPDLSGDPQPMPATAGQRERRAEKASKALEEIGI